MKTITQKYFINAPIEKVWNALTNNKEIDGWGAGPAKMDDKEGTDFSLWDGSIWGKNIEVIKHKKLVQEWYSNEENKWTEPSIVTFTLSENSDGVTIDLLHENIPDKNVKDIEEGWKDYYLGPMMDYLEK